MNTYTNYYFIHILFQMGNLDVDNLLYYDNSTDYIHAVIDKMKEINESIYRNYPDAYINTIHYVMSDNRGGINLYHDKKTNNPYVTKYSSRALWQIIKDQMDRIKENSTYGKSGGDELQNWLKIFNDFIAEIITHIENQNDNFLHVNIKAGNLNQFAPYFIRFLKNKIQQTDDFIGECLNSHFNTIEEMEDIVYSDLYPEHVNQTEQFLEMINTYKSLQKLTDQWINYQVN